MYLYFIAYTECWQCQILTDDRRQVRYQYTHTKRGTHTHRVISSGKYSIWRALTNPRGVADVLACFGVFIAALIHADRHYTHANHTHTYIHTLTSTAEVDRGWDREWKPGRGMGVETMKTTAEPGSGGDMSFYYLWLLLLCKWRPVTMLLTGNCNPGDSLGPVTMETFNQGKCYPSFPTANGSCFFWPKVQNSEILSQFNR